MPIAADVPLPFFVPREAVIRLLHNRL